MLEIENKKMHQKVLEKMSKTLDKMAPKEPNPLEKVLSSMIKLKEMIS